MRGSRYKGDCPLRFLSSCGGGLRETGARGCLEADSMKQVRPDRDVFRAQYEANRKIILATQTICGICGKPVDKTLKYPDPMSATVDHIVPIARHGHPSALENLQLAHRSCNRAKSDHPPGEGIRNINIISHSLPQSHDWRTF